MSMILIQCENSSNGYKKLWWSYISVNEIVEQYFPVYTGSIPGLGRSPGEGRDNPLQYSCLENPMDRGAWWIWSTGSQRVGHD